MYHPTLNQRQIETVEQRASLKLVRYAPWQSEERAAELDKLRKQDGTFKRPLKKEEHAFIMNERLLAKLDFQYWCERYGTIEFDPAASGGRTGIGKPELWESQLLLLNLVGRLENDQYDAYQRGEPVDGIIIADHKARQIGHTELIRLMAMHRQTLWSYTRGAAASVDNAKKHELYRRDKVIYDNLPFFLKPKLQYDVKDEHIEFEGLKSWTNYMEASMNSSFGQSMQHDFAHLTECSEWGMVSDPRRIEIDFLPTLPQSPMTCCILESRANGRGNWWHEHTEAVRRGRKARWTYSFIPWYAEPKKYRRTPPEGWTASEEALLHAKKVLETSVEFIGKAVHLGKEQLYWWESTRLEYQEGGNLNLFLTNYCATPEESFQHSGQSAFDAALLEKFRNMTTMGLPYEVRLGSAA